MVIIKAKGEYYYRELQRLENESSISDNEKVEISRKKLKYKDLDNDLVKSFRSMFNKGKYCVIFLLRFLWII